MMRTRPRESSGAHGSELANRRHGLILAAIATVLWSTTGLIIDPLTSIYGASAVQLSFWRSALVALALGLLLAWRGSANLRFERREVPYFLVYGAVGVALFNVVWSASVALNKAAIATALIFSAPAFVALGAFLFFKERLRRVQVAAIGVTVLGCALVAGISAPSAFLHSPGGLLLGMASGLTFAVYTLFGRGAGRVTRRGSLEVLCYIFTVASCTLLVWLLVADGPSALWPRLNGWGWCLLIGLALGPTLSGYACFTASLRFLPAGSASLITTLEPPITAVLALFLLGRHLDAAQWLGTALIVGGVVLMQRAA